MELIWVSKENLQIKVRQKIKKEKNYDDKKVKRGQAYS